MTAAPVPKVALVTGANRGIGREVCRQLGRHGMTVVLGSRDPRRGREAAAELVAAGADVRVEQLDVTNPGSVLGCAERLAADGVMVDVVVNNAGTYPTTPFFALDEKTLGDALNVHLFGAFRTCMAFVPAMRRRGYGRVVNVSSGGGALTDNIPGPAAYGIAKAALNALTLVVSAAAPEVRTNAVCPGWVRTDMGGSAAPVSVADGADTIVWLATRPDGGPTGAFFRGRNQIPW